MASTTFPAVGPYGYATTTTGADEGTNYDDIVIIVLGIAVVAVVLVMTYYIANQMRWIENNRPPMPQKQVKPASRPTLCVCLLRAFKKKKEAHVFEKPFGAWGRRCLPWRQPPCWCPSKEAEHAARRTPHA